MLFFIVLRSITFLMFILTFVDTNFCVILVFQFVIDIYKYTLKYISKYMRVKFFGVMLSSSTSFSFL